MVVVREFQIQLWFVSGRGSRQLQRTDGSREQCSSETPLRLEVLLTRGTNMPDEVVVATASQENSFSHG